MIPQSTIVKSRLTRIGNSKGIILPRKIVRSLALSDGDPVSLSYDESTQILSVQFLSTKQLTLEPGLHI